jgi:hypothetical protein
MNIISRHKLILTILQLIRKDDILLAAVAEEAMNKRVEVIGEDCFVVSKTL